MSLVPLTELIRQENLRSPRGRPSKSKPSLPTGIRSMLDAKYELEKIVCRIGLQKVLPRKHTAQLAEQLHFSQDSHILFQIGSEVVFILADEYKTTPDDTLKTIFATATPNLIYRRKVCRGSNPKELSTVWVYLEIEPPERRLPDYDYSWGFRQSLWSFL